MSVFTALESNLLADQVYIKLKEAIFSKKLPPGHKLDIYQFVEQFNVSRTPIKEAFNRLSHEGLIVIKPRKGTFVAELNRKEIIEILDARLMIEMWAGREGIHSSVEKDITHLEQISTTMNQHYNTKPFNYLEFMELDSKFHEYLVQLGNNQRILEIYKGLNAHRMIALGYYEIAYEKVSVDEHSEIVESIRTRNEQKFLELINKHISDAKKGLLNLSD